MSNNLLIYYQELANFITSGGFADYYQWLKLGDPTDFTDCGTGGNDALLISGSMAGEDLVMNWTRGDSILTDLAETYGIPNPEITYDEMKQVKASDSWIITKHD